MKRVDFDVFSLISPLQSKKDVSLELGATVPLSKSFKLAKAIRSSRFVLPQVELVGQQITLCPSPVRHLQFSRYEVPDYALKKVISTLEKHEQNAIRGYLWSEGRFEYDRENKRWIEYDPPFSDEAEQAFGKAFFLLEKLAVLRPRPRRAVSDGGPAL